MEVERETAEELLFDLEEAVKDSLERKGTSRLGTGPIPNRPMHCEDLMGKSNMVKRTSRMSQGKVEMLPYCLHLSNTVGSQQLHMV